MKILKRSDLKKKIQEGNIVFLDAYNIKLENAFPNMPVRISTNKDDIDKNFVNIPTNFFLKGKGCAYYETEKTIHFHLTANQFLLFYDKSKEKNVEPKKNY